MPQDSKLKVLPTGKTFVFWSPMEGEDNLVRTGTMKDGSCFFHSILHACSKEYSRENKKGKKTLVKKLRSGISSELSREKWESLGNGNVSRISFQENTHDILNNFYKYINDGIEEKNIRKVVKKIDENVKDIVSDLIPLKVLTSEILPNAYKDSEQQNISLCREAMVDKISSYIKNIDEMKGLDKVKRTYIIAKVLEIFKILFEHSENYTYRKYVKSIKNTTEEVDSYMFELISDRVNRDIYILDANTKMPYINFSNSNTIKRRKSIIILWINNNHYEIVGRLLPGERVQREFTHEDDLIQRFYTFTMHPKNIYEKYPDLVEFLPKDIRNNDTEESSYDYSDDESYESFTSSISSS